MELDELGVTSCGNKILFVEKGCRVMEKILIRVTSRGENLAVYIAVGRKMLYSDNIKATLFWI